MPMMVMTVKKTNTEYLTMRCRNPLPSRPMPRCKRDFSDFPGEQHRQHACGGQSKQKKQSPLLLALRRSSNVKNAVKKVTWYT